MRLLFFVFLVFLSTISIAQKATAGHAFPDKHGNYCVENFHKVHDKLYRIEGRLISMSTNEFVHYKEWSTTLSSVNSIREYIYPNGKLKGKIVFKNGKYQGGVTSYHPNGKKMCEATFNKGMCIGKFKQYHSNGKLKTESTVYNDLITQVYKEYYKDGGLKRKVEFDSGIINGSYEEYSESSVLLLKINYLRGVPEGLAYSYDEGGNLICKVHFKNGKLTQSEINKNNAWRFNETIKKYKVAKINKWSVDIVVFTFPAAKEVYPYYKGRYHGQVKKTIDSGDSSLTNYSFNRKHGLSVYYNKGIPTSFQYFHKNRVIWNVNNRLGFRFSIKSDFNTVKKHSMVWHSDTTIFRHIVRCSRGEVVLDTVNKGAFTLKLYKDEILSCIYKVSKDFLITDCVGYYPNGNIKFIYPFKDGVVHGEVKIYDKEGNHLRSVSYINGKKQTE